MMLVLISNLCSASWNSIYTVISSNVSDPTGKSKYIFTTAPDKIWEDKSSFPIIVIYPIESNGSETISITRGTKDFGLRLAIEVYSTNAEQLDSISDSILSTIESNELVLYNDGIDNFELTNVNVDTIDRGKFRVHTRRLEWDFSFFKVS